MFGGFMNIKKVVLALGVALGVFVSTQAGPVDGLVTTLQVQVGTQLLNFVNSSLASSSELPMLQRIIAGMGSNLAYLQAQANSGDMGAATAFGTIAGILGSEDITVKLQSTDDVRRLMTSFMNASSLLEQSSHTTVPTTSVYVMQLYYDFSYVLSKLPSVVAPVVVIGEAPTITPSPPEAKPGRAGLSVGVIAGIAAGAVAIIGGALLVAYKVNKKRKAARAEEDSTFEIVSPSLLLTPASPSVAAPLVSPELPAQTVAQSAMSAPEVLTVVQAPVEEAHDDVMLIPTSDSAVQSCISMTQEKFCQLIASIVAHKSPPAAAPLVAARQLPQLQVGVFSHAIISETDSKAAAPAVLDSDATVAPLEAVRQLPKLDVVPTSCDITPEVVSAAEVPDALDSGITVASAAVPVAPVVLNVQKSSALEIVIPENPSVQNVRDSDLTLAVSNSGQKKSVAAQDKPESSSKVITLLSLAGAASVGALAARLSASALGHSKL